MAKQNHDEASGAIIAASTALRAAGYDLSLSEADHLVLAVSDGDDDGEAETALSEIRNIVGPVGCVAEWTGDGNTDADGYSTSDVRIDVDPSNLRSV